MKYKKVNCLDTNHKITEEKILHKLTQYVIDGTAAKLGYDATRAKVIKELSEQ